MKARWRATDNKPVIWVLLLPLLAFNNFLQAHLPPGNLSTHSDVFDGAAFSTLLSIDCSLLSTVSLVWAVYLWKKTGLEYYQRSSESLESFCGNARRNRRPLAAEYLEHPAAMFVFFCPQYQELPSEGSLHGARKILVLGRS